MNDILTLTSISHLHQFLGVEAPKHPLVSVLRHHNPNLNLEWDGDMRFTGEFYQIGMKDGVTGQFGYGRNSYDYQNGTMVFLSPGQVVGANQAQLSPEGTAWILSFHPDLIRRSELGRKIHEYSYFSYDLNEALHLSQDEQQSLTELVQKIEKEYNQNIDRYSQNLIIANIELILEYCLRYYDRQFYLRTNLNKDIATRFEALLHAYYASEKPLHQGVPTVKYFGEELSMSWNYLSDLLKKETGRNAQEHIHFFLIEKAKTDLLRSPDTISQIAYDLGFEYPQHFTRLFKKKTGQSPREWRRLN